MIALTLWLTSNFDHILFSGSGGGGGGRGNSDGGAVAAAEQATTGPHKQIEIKVSERLNSSVRPSVRPFDRSTSRWSYMR